MIETTVKIDGMMCGMCEAHVSDVIRSKFNIKKVSASHSKGQAVILSDGPLDEAALRKAIGDTGYTVTDVTLRPFEKKGLFGMFKRFPAGFCFTLQSESAIIKIAFFLRRIRA